MIFSPVCRRRMRSCQCIVKTNLEAYVKVVVEANFDASVGLRVSVTFLVLHGFRSPTVL